MAAPSLTYTLTNGTPADASAVMQDLNDLLLGYTDGTKDLSISKLTLSSTLNKLTLTAPATAATLTIIDGTTVTGPAASGTIMTLGNAEAVTGVKTFGDGKLLVAGSSSGSSTIKAPATGGGTATLFAGSDTVVGLATTDTMTNKTLTSPKLNENVAVTTTATKLNYITSATGSTGTNSTNIVFSAAPTLTGLASFEFGTFNGDANPIVSILQSSATASASKRVLTLRYSVVTDCTGGVFLQFVNQANVQAGRVEAASNTSVTYVTTSDERLKSPLRDFDGIALAKQMDMGAFHWLDKPEVENHGGLAQKLHKIYPEAVSVGTDEVNAAGQLTTPWGIDYGKLSPVAIRAIVQLSERLDLLEARVA